VSPWWVLLFVAFTIPAWAQNDVRVRLYAVHPPETVTLTGTGLQWKGCETCPATAASRMVLTAAHGQVRVEGAKVSFPKVFVSGSYRVAAESQQPVPAAYPLEIRAQQDALVLVLTMPMEDYVGDVLAGEAGGFKQLESMKAMAVAVRTYAARFRNRHAAEGFDFCDTTHCQDLRMTSTNLRTRLAAQATAGELLWYQGALATTYYDQHCGGTTAAAEEVWPTVHAPYLKSHPDPYCVAQPLHWQTTLSHAEIEQALASSQVKAPAGWKTITIASRTASGRAQRLRFAGPSGAADVSASTLRFAVGREFGWNRIRSDLYELKMDGDGALFIGAGAGHGVGLCQAGAEVMAAQGKTYRDILSFYYPGTTVASRGAVEWQTRKSDHFDALVTSEADASVLQVAERLLKEVEGDTSWQMGKRPQIQVFPTLDAYRDTTGQPGWVAATTRGATIRLQPLNVLKQHGVLETTLRHELLHLVMEPHAGKNTPAWLKEGLALYFDGSPARPARAMTDAEMERALTAPRDQAEQQAAYGGARARVAGMIRDKGKEAVLRQFAGAAR
jgi:stage II sporulation protein D